jgi:hypothetical protein
MEQPVLYNELWEHHVFPAMSLRELALVALTCKAMRKFCRTFLVERITERHLRTLVARLRQDDLSSIDTPARLSLRFTRIVSINWPREFELCYSPIFGILHMQQVQKIKHRASRYDFKWKPLFLDQSLSDKAGKDLSEYGPCLFGLHFFPVFDRAIAAAVKRVQFEEARQAYLKACSEEEEEEEEDEEECSGRPWKRRRLLD